MREETRELSRSIDLELLGSRIKSARLRAGLTQAQVAGAEMSVGYISRIESGQRRPDPELLDVIAERLGLTPEDLVLGVSPDQITALHVEVDHAELALGTGSPQDALDRTSRILASNDFTTLPDLLRKVRLVHARALRSLGDPFEAIAVTEKIVEAEPHDLEWLKALTFLSSTLLSTGDLFRSVEVGENALRYIEGLGLEHSVEAVRLALTVAAAYAERGDVDHAARLCRRCIEKAESLDSTLARASAYWNASVAEQMRGNFSAARDLGQRALALLEETDDSRNIGRLRSQLGIILISDTIQPEPEEALVHLSRAVEEMKFTGAPPADLSLNLLGQARAHFLLGDIVRGRDMAEEARAAAHDGHAPLVEAECLALQGQMAVFEGDTATARERYQSAVMVLSALGADRPAAQMWFELGGLLEEIGEATLALQAFRSASVSNGMATQYARPQRASSMATFAR